MLLESTLLCVLLVVCLSGTWVFAEPNLPPLSCADAQIPNFEASSGFCDFVDWWAARAYSASNFTYFDTGSAMTPYDQQRNAALFYRDLLLDISNNSRGFKNTQDCVDAVYTLACLQAYPFCPLADMTEYDNRMQSISYLHTCQVHCKMVKHYCLDTLIKEKNVEIEALSKYYHCEDYPVDNCAMHLDNSLYFVLDPDKGPFEGLESLYIALLIIWLIVVSVTYRLGLTRESSRRLENLVAFLVPLLKTFVNVFALPFWTSCVQTVCSRWLVNAMINVHLLYETMRIFWYLMLAKGFQISRNLIPQNAMRNMMLTSAGFFFSAVVLVAFAYSNVAVMVLYGLCYAYIVGSTTHQIYIVDQQKQYLANALGETREPAGEGEEEHANTKVIRPIFFKQRLYYAYLFMVFLSMLGTILVVTLRDEGVSLLVLITVYEVLDLVSTCSLLALFRPRSLSPFFYLEVFNPEAVEETENQLQQTGNIKSFEADVVPTSVGRGVSPDPMNASVASVDIETAPLLQPTSEFSEVELVPARMVIVRNPDALRLGISHLM